MEALARHSRQALQPGKFGLPSRRSAGHADTRANDARPPTPTLPTRPGHATHRLDDRKQTDMKLIAQITIAILLAWLIQRAIELMLTAAALHGISVGLHQSAPLPALPRTEPPIPTPVQPQSAPSIEPRPRTPYTLPSAQDCNTPDNPRCSIHRSSSGP